MSVVHMRAQPRWYYPALLPVVAGLAWFIVGWGSVWPVAVIATLPGTLCLGAATALLLWPGDRHITHALALSSVVAFVLALVIAVGVGLGGTLTLLVASVICFLSAGYAALVQGAWPENMPVPRARLNLARKAATDEALLGFFVATAHVPRGSDAARDAREIADLQGAVDARSDHHSFLTTAPGAPSAPRLGAARSLGHEFEWLTFDSGFEPDSALPGAARWRSYRANETMAARVFRHPGSPRPWLLCIHGYRMGAGPLDLSLFAVKRLYRELGMNLLLPILPLHGARSVSRMSGGRFFDGPLLDMWHAETQSLWDLRRCLAWIRAQQPGVAVGTLGYSLGGYNAALLACLEPALACAIAAIPVTDLPAALWAHMPLLHRRYLQAQGVDIAQLSTLMAPVSPLHRSCAIAHRRRFILAATADQLVEPKQPLDLWRHWEAPAIHWYHGSHLSVRSEPDARAFVESALYSTGLAAQP